jgi:hypothetical protein
MSLNDPKQEK